MSFSVAIENLSAIRGHRVVFAGLSLALEEGALVALEGPNGAGKTTLLRIIAGFLAPGAGMVRIRTDAGEAVEGEDRARLVGWLGHQDAIKPQLTVREQLRFWARLYGSAAGDADRFGLGRLATVPGQFLSAGQKRRLALARLMLMGRRLWLIDEPLASLDSEGKALVAEAIAAHCASGGIAIAATHEPLGLEARTLRLGGA